MAYYRKNKKGYLTGGDLAYSAYGKKAGQVDRSYAGSSSSTKKGYLTGGDLAYSIFGKKRTKKVYSRYGGGRKSFNSSQKGYSVDIMFERDAYPLYKRLITSRYQSGFVRGYDDYFKGRVTFKSKSDFEDLRHVMYNHDFNFHAGNAS